MRINKALIDRALDVPSVNENAAMMYRRLISLIDQYNLLARDKGLPIKQIPVYGNNVNCALMSRLIGSIIKDIDRVKNIKEKEEGGGSGGDTPPTTDKILKNVEFTDNKFTEDIWTYKIISGTENNAVSVGLNLDEFSEASVTLGYNDMPYEKLITGDGTIYLTVSYENMFSDLPTDVKTLNIDNWTNRNVTDMSNMFAGCETIESLSLGHNFNTSSVTDMENMFEGCKNLKTLALDNNVDTRSLAGMNNAFASRSVLATLSLGNSFDTSKVTNMSSTFSGCSSLSTLSLGESFNTSSVTNMNYMFNGCNNLTTLTLYHTSSSIVKELPSSTWTITNADSDKIGTVKTIQGLLSTWDEGVLDQWANASWNLSPTIQTMKNVEFTNYALDYGIWTYTILNDSDKTISVALNVSAFSREFTGSSVTLGYDDMPYERLIVKDDTEYSTVSYKEAFKELPSTVTSLTINNWTNFNVWNMTSMFSGCSSLTSLSFEDGFNVYNVTDMVLMFNGCSSLTSLSFGNNFNAYNVKDMHNMFSGCKVLTALSFGDTFNTTKLLLTYGMFSGCKALTTLSFSAGFNTTNVGFMYSMFSSCNALNSITLYQDASSIIKELPLATWTIIDANSSSVGTVTIEQGSKVTWSSGEEPAQWANEPWTFSNPAKTLNGVTFTGNTFTKDLWTYTITGTNVGVKLNGDAFNAQFSTATSVTLGYEHMPYEKLITGDGTIYLTVSYIQIFSELLPSTLKTLTIDNWTNRNVTDMNAMFGGCYTLTSLSLGNNFNTSNVTNMNTMFSGCYTLTTLSLGSNFDTSKVTTMDGLFSSCFALTSLSLGNNFNTSNVTNMSYMFYGCNALNSITLYQDASSIIKELPLGTWTVKNNEPVDVNTVTVSEGSSVTWGESGEPAQWENSPWTFYNPAKVLDDGSFTGNTFTKDLWTYTITGTNVGVKLNGDAFNAQFSTATSVTLGYEHMPYEKLITGDGTIYLTVSYESMFSDLPTDVKTLNIDNWTNRNVTSMSSMFANRYALTTLSLDNNFDTSAVTNMNNMFANCYALTTLSLGDMFDTSKVMDMSSMFIDCTVLQALSLGPNFNTSSVTDMKELFAWCSSLTTLSLGDKFDTTNVTNMNSMFYNCYALTELSLGNSFDTSVVTNMNSMFANCYALTTLSLGDKFDTSKVTSMSSMFANCYALTTLSLGNSFDTSEVRDMNNMFASCWALQSLLLGYNFDTSKVTNMGSMFSGCMSLNSIPLYGISKSIVKALPLATWTVTDNNSVDVDTVTVSEESSVTWNQGEPAQWTNSPWTFSSPAKILNGVTFTGVTFTKDLWTYTVNTEAKTVSVTLKENAFSTESVTLGYNDMPYEKLITSDGTEYLTTSYWGMFNRLQTTVKTLTIDNWTNRNVTDMGYMFNDRSALTTLTLGDNFNTTNVTNMHNMFRLCSALTGLSLGDNFNTTNVTNMLAMFEASSALTELSLGNTFNTHKLTNTGYMFRLCSALQSLTLGVNFDTTNVVGIIKMFQTASSLNSVTLYQPSSSIIKALPTATWTVTNNRSDEVNKVTVSESVSASWTYDEPATWTLVPWTLSRTIQAQ